MTETSPQDEFIEQMGLIMQAEGPRIAGRIFGLLIVEGKPFTLTEMAERLGISKASASTNARLLVSHGVVELTSRPGDRQDYYQVGASPYRRMMKVISGRMKNAATRIRAAADAFPENDSDGAKERVEAVAYFYEQSREVIDDWAERLDAEASPSPQTESRQ